MSLINDVLEQIDARAPVAEPERVVIEPSAYTYAAKTFFVDSPRLKLIALALAGFASGYSALAVVESLVAPTTHFVPTTYVAPTTHAVPSTQVVTTSDLNNFVLPADVQPHAHLALQPVEQAAPAELSITGQLNKIESAAPSSAALEEATLLAQAQQYFLADRLTYPPLNNAYQVYREILLKNPHNSVALAGIASIKRRYVVLTAEAINQGAKEKAQRYIERAEFVGVDNAELNLLRGQLHALMPIEPAAMVDGSRAPDIQAQPMAENNLNSFNAQGAVNEHNSSAAPTEQEYIGLNASATPRLSINNTRPVAAPVNEQVFLAGLIEDKNSERAALDFIKSQGNAADTVRWLARRWVSAQQWLPLLDLMNTPSAISASERDVFRAQALLGLKNYSELISWLKDTQHLEQPELQRILAVALQKTGRQADAMAIYQHLVARHPDNSGLWLALGLSADEAGNKALAREAFLRAQQLGGHSKTVSDFLASRLAAAQP